MVGLPVILGGSTTTTTAKVQVAGSGVRMKAEALVAEFKRGGELQSLLLRYTQALFTFDGNYCKCYIPHNRRKQR